MNAVREAWTDERLDDLQAGMHREFAQVRTEMNFRFDQVDRRFDQVDKRFEQVDKRFDKIDEKFDKVDARFVAMDARFDALSARFDGLERTLIAGCVAIVAAIIATGIF
jgi:predicted nuclease with TOPRIM domain